MTDLKRREMKKVFLCAVCLPKRICQDGIRLERVEAIYEGGNRFNYVFDQSNYVDSCWQMWDKLREFCADCGLTVKDGEVWYSEYTDEDYNGSFVHCEVCKYSNCFVFTDNLEYLSKWRTKYMHNEFRDKCTHLEKPLSFEMFKEYCDYKSSGGAAALWELYGEFRRAIDKDSFTLNELHTMAEYVRDKRDRVFGREFFQIEWAMVRLLCFDKVLFQSCAEMLIDCYEGEGQDEEELFYFFNDIYFDYCDAYICADGRPIDKDYNLPRRYAAVMAESCGSRFAAWYDRMYKKLNDG